MSEPITYFRYVHHWRIGDYLAIGWTVCCTLGRPHGAYSVLMQWTLDGEPREPALASTETQS
jgi:hypothetical protein